MAAIKITAKKSGPLRVEGDLTQLELTDFEGNPYDLTGKPGISLCRCGHSANKPFCDGSHKTSGFVAEETAPKPGPPVPPSS